MNRDYRTKITYIRTALIFLPIEASGEFKEGLSIEGLFNSLQTKKQAQTLNGLYAILRFSDSGLSINNRTVRSAINKLDTGVKATF